MSDTNFDKMVDGGSQETEIVPVDEGQSNVQLANFSNHVDFASEDIVIPRIKLAQQMTSEVVEGGAQFGQWILTGYESADELTVIPLLFARNRSLRDDAGAILCRSNDGAIGVGDPGGECNKCPMTQWKENAKGANLPPPCVFSYNYICYVVEYGALGMMEFKRTSMNAGKTLNTICAQRGLGNFAIKLKSSQAKSKKGTYAQPIVQPIVIDQDTLDLAKAFLNQ